MAEKRPIFQILGDSSISFKYFVEDFHNYCILEDHVDTSKARGEDGYWIENRRPKAVAALQRAFPQSEWASLTAKVLPNISELDRRSPAKWLLALESHYVKAEPILQSSYTFLRKLKQPDEMTAQEWETMVRTEFVKCRFPVEAADRLQRDIFLFGLKEQMKGFRTDILTRELDVEGLTFRNVGSRARAYEDGQRTEHSIMVKETVSQVEPVDAVSQPLKGKEDTVIRQCKFCTGTHNKGQCPAWGKRCNYCQKMHHFSKCCQARHRNVTKQGVVHANLSDSVKVDDYDVCYSSSCTGPPKEWKIVVKCEGRDLSLKVDTGSSCNVIPLGVIRELGLLRDVKKTSRNLVSYSGHALRVVGEITLFAEYRDRFHLLQSVVVKEAACCLLGLSSCQEMGLVEMSAMVNSTIVAQQYQDVFEGLGKLPSAHSLKLKEGYTPTTHPARRVPYRLHNKLRSTLDNMETMGVIIKVRDPTEWCHPIITVLKENC